jgi:hypothetical protein
MDNKLFIFACIISCISFTFLAAMVFIPMPSSGVEFAKPIAGFLMGVGLSTILNYYYGSSKGSADKTKFFGKNEPE